MLFRYSFLISAIRDFPHWKRLYTRTHIFLSQIKILFCNDLLGCCRHILARYAKLYLILALSPRFTPVLSAKFLSLLNCSFSKLLQFARSTTFQKYLISCCSRSLRVAQNLPLFTEKIGFMSLNSGKDVSLKGRN